MPSYFVSKYFVYFVLCIFVFSRYSKILSVEHCDDISLSICKARNLCLCLSVAKIQFDYTLCDTLELSI
jgi:hypothetical protein